MKTLGLDIGTNSIGWAIINGSWVDSAGKHPFFTVSSTNDVAATSEDEAKSNDSNTSGGIVDAGVVLFPISIEAKEQTKTLAHTRREHRAARRHYDRRRRRKINTLRALSKNKMCPPISENELKEWKYNKKFPDNEAFTKWLGQNINPYELRWRAVHEELPPYELGRVLYHLAQRRGFLSNRKSERSNTEDSKVYASIGNLDKEIEHSGEQTLGAYFAKKYNTYIALTDEDKKAEHKATHLVRHYKIREQYTGRIQHYYSEFEAICKQQKIGDAVRKELFKAMYYQRPLKSQKLTVGKCTLEPKRVRCAMSNPVFERFRMRQLINNIKITLGKEAERALSAEDIDTIEPLFFQSKDNTLEDLRKKLNKKYKISVDDVHTNYDRKARDAKLKRCTTLAQLMNVFLEKSHERTLANLYEQLEACARVKNQSVEHRVQDLWHALYYAELQTQKTDEEINAHLKKWVQKHYSIDDDQAEKFSGISLSPGYAKLSFMAMKNILVFLERGVGYSHAVFFARLPEIFAQEWDSHGDEILESIHQVIDEYSIYAIAKNIINDYVSCLREGEIPAVLEFINEAVEAKKLKEMQLQIFDAKHRQGVQECCKLLKEDFIRSGRPPEFHLKETLEERVGEKVSELQEHYGTSVKASMYHPSKVDFSIIPDPHPRNHTVPFPLPDLKTIRNPVYIRAVHQVRKLLIELLKKHKIDEKTRIHVEVARDVNTLNAKQAIKIWQGRNQKAREEAKANIKEFIKREANESEIKKYLLWKEQNECCIYTGCQIATNEFLGENPKYEIEHTIPQSLYYDSTMANLTLCELKFNREVKKNRLPTELPRNKYDEIIQRIENLGWKEKREKADKNRSKSNANIVNRHLAQMEYDYWNAKCSSFEITREALQNRRKNFASYKLPTTRMIASHVTKYLKTVFDNVYGVEGQITSQLRGAWLNTTKDEIDLFNYSKKNRAFHQHHAEDAILVALCQRKLYSLLTTHWKETEIKSNSGQDKIPFAPWKGFSDDVKHISRNILPYLYTPYNYFKQTKKKLRTKSGKVAKDSQGKPIYQRGRGVRVALNDENPLKLSEVNDNFIKLARQLYYNPNKEQTEYKWAKTGTGSNYLGLIYQNSKGERHLEVVRAIDTLRGETYPSTIKDNNGEEYQLYQKLHPKQRVLFYHENTQEIIDLIKDKCYDVLQARLFDIQLLKKDGRILFKRSIYAPTIQSGNSQLFDEKLKLADALLLTKKNWNFIVEHKDFSISRAGKITLNN